MFSSNTTQVSDGGYQISRSLRFNRPDSAYLTRTPATTTNQKTFTLSFWYKQGSLVDEYYAYALFIVRSAGPTYFRLTVTGSQSGTPLQIRCEDSVGIDVQTTRQETNGRSITRT